MAINKTPLAINFAQGLDTKTDEWQASPGKFLSLQNSVFDKAGQLKKRNGFGNLTTLPDSLSTFVTTFNGNLTAIGTNLNAYSQSSDNWVTKGSITPVNLDVLTLIRSNTNQTQVDTAIASNGLVCTVFTDVSPSGTTYKYAVANSVTGQNIVSPTVITSTTGSVTTSPKVFILGNYFIVTFTVSAHIQFIAISINQPTVVTPAADITTTFVGSNLSYDAAVYSGQLYVFWNSLTGGQSVKAVNISQSLVISATSTFSSQKATHMSLCIDTTVPSIPVIYASYYDSVSTNGYVLGVYASLSTALAPTQDITATVVDNITCSAQNGVVTTLYEVDHKYTYDTAIPSHYVQAVTVTKATAVVGTPTMALRSVGLASKSFLINKGTTSNVYPLFSSFPSPTGISGVLALASDSNKLYISNGTIWLANQTQYALVTYVSPYQPTYFLTDTKGNIVAKFAYSNGGGYLTTGLPSVTVTNDTAQVAYRYKDLIQAVNKNTNTPPGTQVAGIYSQTGLNLATMVLGTQEKISTEIGANLNLTGGFVWNYDGYSLTEQNFFVWPDSVEATPSTTGGSIGTGTYFYQVTYEWTDNQGNAFKSAPSIPIGPFTTTGSTSSIVVNIPTLRLTYKTANPVKLVVYRWSAAQEVYYQATSISSPLLNDPTVDYLTFTDTLSDNTILGNSILYTTGGVVEDISPPATNSMFLFDDRMWLIDAEDKNLLWFSKQVIEATPVEMSDLFTLYVAPTVGAQGSTGVLQCGAAMDDKLILFKKDAIYYINGTGPDNTGANNQYSQPVFITSTVGCANQASIVFTPQGLMFQSDKGIWLLGRDLSSSYIGAPVEAFNQNIVQSAVNVPGTNQVRFTLDNGVALMYDYYYGQWGTFTNIPAISSTLYQGLHTYLSSFSGQVLQETVDKYLDGSNPTLMSFTTSWLNLAGLQGYERAYFFFLIGKYLSPHKLQVQVGYNYNPSPSQSVIISPDNFSPAYGGNTLWGGGPSWGGGTSLEQWRVFFNTQKVQSFQVTINELYDPSKGVVAGAGLTLSGLNMIVGLKKGYKTIKAANSIG